MNLWNIPAPLEQEIVLRDKACVYCGAAFDAQNRPTWEHIINDENIITRENIALCCRPCNSSKGVKELAVWLESAYCKKRGISPDTVSDVIKKALQIKSGTPNAKN